MIRIACIGICAAAINYAAQGADKATTQRAFRAEPATRPSPNEQSRSSRTAIEEAVKSYESAFNKHDVSALAGMWSSDGIYENHETGEVLEGREAIRIDLEGLFKGQPDIRISAQVDKIRFIGTTAAKVTGTATVEGSEPETSRFLAIYEEQEGHWLLNNVEESSAPKPVTAHEALQELAWLVGKWQDESPDVQVETNTRWSRTGAYLIRSYTVQVDEEEPREGTQVIGWDPRMQQIRSWIFDGDGSFGEGVWSRSGDDWLVRLNFLSDDGGMSTATQVITRIDDDHIRVQMIGRELDGDPLPSSEPILVSRISTQGSTDAGR